MLNRKVSSNSNNDKNINKNNKKQHRLRSPLGDVNSIAGIDTSGYTNISRSSSPSSSSSNIIEAQKGCLRFFLSNSSASKDPNLRRPKSLSRTTPNFKSALNAKPSKPFSSSSSRSDAPLKENLPKTTSQKDKRPIKNPPFLYKCQSAKKSDFEPASIPMPTTCSKQKQKQKQKQCPLPILDGKLGEPPEHINLAVLGINLVEESTPVGKLASGSVVECDFDDKIEVAAAAATTTTTTTTTTPPIQVSVSPEIQCGSSSSMLPISAAKTPVCYGAGHIVSGVTDRRKCRARGILTVEQMDSVSANANILENGDDLRVTSKSRMSLVPLPSEASVHWLLSPCDKLDEEQMASPQNGLNCVHSSSSCYRNSSDLGNNFENSSTTSPSGRRGSRITLLSPSESSTFHDIWTSSSVSPRGKPTCDEFSWEVARQDRYDFSLVNSPLSVGSLDSKNVIQTPQSDSSSGRRVGMSWLNTNDNQNHDYGYDIDSATEDLQRASLSPKINKTIWDPPGFSFQLSEFISTSNSTDIVQLPNAWENRASYISNSISEEMSASQMRISWRDGLVSRVFEMDEFDCCRCLSDDENNSKNSDNDKCKSNLSHELILDMVNGAKFGNGFRSDEFVGHAPNSNGERKEDVATQRSNPCAESICTDGGGLVASGDSDWTSCYKNNLFEL